MFRTVPLSIIRSFSLYTQQWYMLYRFADKLRAGSGWNSILILLASCQQTCITCTIAVCTVKNSWWWTEELSETCRVLFQKWIWEISAYGWFHYKNLYLYLFLCNNFWNKALHVSDSSSVHHQEFFTVHTAMVYVIQVSWQLASRIPHQQQNQTSSVLILLASCQ